LYPDRAVCLVGDPTQGRGHQVDAVNLGVGDRYPVLLW